MNWWGWSAEPLEREKKTDGLFCIDHRTERVMFQSGIIGIKKGRYCARMIWKIKVLWAIAHRTFIFHIILAQYRPFFIPIIPLWNITLSVLWSMQNKPSVFFSLSSGSADQPHQFTIWFMQVWLAGSLNYVWCHKELGTNKLYNSPVLCSCIVNLRLSIFIIYEIMLYLIM